MANEEHLTILKQGVAAWNEWYGENRDRPDFKDADLSNANLSGANLRDANLSGANLLNADLSGANFFAADLSHTDLDGADLANADFTDTDLRRATLCYANLLGARLHHADLNEADFQYAFAGLTKFVNCDLSVAKGLELIQHFGPSTIGIDTIYKSKGKIPESFLRGCGVPEGFITQMSSLVDAKDGIQFYSCFISHSTNDKEFADHLHKQMQQAHLRVWYAPQDIQGGKKVHEQIDTAIRIYDKLLIVLSEASLQSEWVMDELRKGFKEERDTRKRKLFPVRLTDYKTLQSWVCRDSISGKDLAEEVRQYFIPDFSNWKDHDQFEMAFARLLKDLRAEERAK
jgi:TIR domain/Pentapeptide repeats (8 copies)